MIRQEVIGIAALAGIALAIGLVAGVRPAAQPALAAVSVALPDDDAVDLHSDLLTSNCTACHSVAMIARQPALTPVQWAAIVKKMQEVYKAPVAEADVPAIVDQLSGLSAAQQPGT